MSCPLCGATEECRCSAREFQPRHVRRSRFQPDEPLRRIAQDFQPDDTLVENESSDLSEQQFAASLNATSCPPGRARFVVDNGAPLPSASTVPQLQPGTSAEIPLAVEDDPVRIEHAQAVVEPDEVSAGAITGQMVSAQDRYPWRDEVAERVHNYRVRRRRRTPRYPSLSLKFEAPEQRYSAPAATDAVAPRISLDTGVAELATPRYCAPSPAARAAVVEPKIIEFPKPVPPPLPILDVPIVEELAEAIVEGPRILDAPEALPQTPPLGGITLEQAEEPAPALELPLQVAPVGTRLVAASIDGAFVFLAGALFAWIAFKVTNGISARTLVEVTLVISALFWALYQYVLMTYSGTTPGMEMAQVRVSCFDGEAPSKRTRRGRVLAMVLSGVSFGLGYLWCLFDEDTLCWHDRITRTYTIRGPRGSMFAKLGALVSRFLPEMPRS